MRLTMVAIGSRGDVDPFVALGRALAEVGHQVRLVTQREFGDSVRHTGIEPWLIDMDQSHDLLELPAARTALRRSLDPRAITRLMTAMAPQFRQVYRTTIDAARGAGAVLCHPMIFPALDVADHLGIPVVQIHHVPMVATRQFPAPSVHRLHRTLGPLGNRLSYSVDERLAWYLTRSVMNGLGNEMLGRSPISTRQALTLRHRRLGAVVAASPRVLSPAADWPPDVVVSGYLHGPPPRHGPLDSATLRFLAAGTPPVFVTLGSTPVPDAAAVTRILAAAARAAGVRIILQRGVANLGAECDPEWVHVVTTIDYPEILRAVPAVVHHAGAGTLAAVLSHGRPSLALPSFADQYFWAHRVPLIGAGPDPLPLRRLTLTELSRRLTDLVTTSRYRIAADDIAAALRREDGPRCAAAAVARFVRAS